MLASIRALLLSVAVAAAALVAPIGRAPEAPREQAAAPREKPEAPREQPVVPIPLGAGLERPEAEISGLAWWGDELLVLPQYPARFGERLFAIRRDAIERFLDGRGEPPAPRPVPLVAPGLEGWAGFEGFEAIAVRGEQVFVTVEVETDRPEGRLVRGRIVGALERIELDVAGAVTLPAQTPIENLAYEALAVDGDRVMVLYETNGANNPAPRVRVFDTELRPLGDVALGAVEYRITDVTEVDAEGRMWAVNYFWPGADWEPGDCPLTARFGRGATHARSRAVERLVELRVTDGGVVPAGTPPVQLELDAEPRNWEGVVRLGTRGFLVVTDEHPSSMLAFVRADLRGRGAR